MGVLSLQPVCVHNRISGENCVFSEEGLLIQKYSQCSTCFIYFFNNCFGFLSILHYDSEYFDWLCDTFQSPLSQSGLHLLKNTKTNINSNYIEGEKEPTCVGALPSPLL